MNKSQAEGKWNQIGNSEDNLDLTDNDFIRADGSVDKLYGVKQQKFGDTKEAIKAKMDKLHKK